MDLQFPTFPILLTSLLFILIVLKIRNKKHNILPPGPWKLPVIGNMHLLIGSLPHHCLRNLAKKYGPLMHLRLGEVSHIVISSPEIAEQVMKTHDIFFADRPQLYASKVISYNFTNIAFAPFGDYWRQLRKVCILELLSAKRVQSFRSIREEEALDLIGSISSKAGSMVNLSKMIVSSTSSIASRVAFGMKCKDLEAFEPTVEKMIKVGGGFSVSDLFPSIKLLQVISGMRSELNRIHQEVDMILENIINQHRSKKATDKAAADEADDLVDVLLNLKDHGDLQFPLTYDNIKSVILDMFLGGSETTSTTIEWALSEMLKNPRVMEKAQAQVRQVFDSQGNVDEAGIHELHYLKLVIKETLRLHPVLPLLLPRECREPCEINGYEIPIKTKVIVNAWAIGRDPKHWIEAESFNPERFLDNHVDYKGTNFEFIPFGAGRRICPGISFGMASVELSLAQLLYHFDWKLPSGIKHEDLDMTEAFGATVKRKRDLCLIPVPYHPLILTKS